MIHLYYNGTIYTGRGQFAECFAVKDSVFLSVGSLEQVRKQCGTDPNQISMHDLHGQFVCAGFNDSHMHLLSLGKSLVEVNLAEHTSSKVDMISYLKQELQARPQFLTSGTVDSSPLWLTGRGWNQESFQDNTALPTRYDLDQVSTEIPIYLARACGHIAVINSKAMEIIGLTPETPQSPEASFDVDDQGNPTGILRENALQWAAHRIPAPGKEEIKDMLVKAGQLVNRYGITSVQSDDFDMWPEVPFETILECYQELLKAGLLSLRINEQCLLPDRNKLERFLSHGYHTGYTLSPDRFRIGPLKLLLDGSLGANTAYLQGEYADMPGEKGMPLYTQEELTALVLHAHTHGMQIAMHAIGDGAVQMGIHAYCHAQNTFPRADVRHGIVHCQLTTAEQLEAFRGLNLHAYIQSIFLDADAPIVEKRVSHELAATSYQAASYLTKGISLSNGSDAPVELPRVMAGIQAAVTRRSLSVSMENPYLPGEALSVSEALDSFTMGGAYASFEEDRKGQIQPGMLADFVILDKNPFTTAPEQLSTISVLATVLGGEIVYSL